MKSNQLVCFPHSKPQVEEVELYFPFLSPNNNLSVVLLSDLHIRNSTKLNEVLTIVEELSPSLLLLLGDYFLNYNKRKVEEFFSLLSRINPPLGKFAVLGNREKKGFYPPLFGKAGTILLRNEYIRLKSDSNLLLLIGVDYDTEDISSLLSSLPPADLSILLSHTPDVVLSRGDWSKVDIVVSGHTHGGQIRFPLIGAVFTKSRLPRRYASGLFCLPGLYLYVSRGIGVSKIPLRFACPPEITLLRIKPGGERKCPR